MMLRSLCLLLFYTFCQSVALASTNGKVIISGKIVSEDGEPIYATVYLKNTIVGTITKENGSFMMEVTPGKYCLAVSAIGYLPVEEQVNISGNHNHFDFVLKADIAMLDEVTVVAKSDSRYERERGFALSSVQTGKAMLGNFATTELLNRTAGVKLRQSGGVGSDIQYNINGMSGNSIRILIDGVPMENYGSSFSISSIPPSMIERIDVYKGVVPAHLTDDALGGAINVILKKPANKSISTSYTYGSFNTHKWDFNGNFRDDKTGFVVQGSAFFNHSNNNYDVWGDKVKVTDPQNGKVRRIKSERFHDKYQSKGITLNIGFTNVKWADRFLLGGIYSDMKKDIQHGATMEVVYGNRQSRQHTYMGKLLYEKKNLVKNLDVNANLTFASGTRQIVDTIPYMYTWEGKIMIDREGNPVIWKKGGGEAGKATLAANLEKNLTGRIRAAYHIHPSQTFAINYLYNQFTRKVEDPYLTQAEQNFMDTRKLSKMIFSMSYDGHFVSDKLQTSLFYKYYHQRARLTDPVVENGELTANKIDRSVGDHGVGGALSYKLHRNILLTFSAEYATRLPGVTELLGNTTANVEPTYSLQPEKSANFNLGALFGTYRWKKHSLDADINLFYRDIKDLIQKSLTKQTDEMYGYENIGKVRSMGVDFDLRYNFDHKVFSGFKTSYVDARFNLQYDEHGTEYIFYRDRLRNDPFFTFNWNLEYVVSNWLQKASRITFTYNMDYVHRFFRNWESLGGAGKAVIPSQFVNDFGILYTLPNKSLSIGADVKNIFNEQVFDNWALQKMGRMFLVKLTYSFAK